MPGYSGTPLAAKLGLKAGCRVCVVHEPDDYRAWLAPLPEGLVFQNRLAASSEIVHLFSRTASGT